MKKIKKITAMLILTCLCFAMGVITASADVFDNYLTYQVNGDEVTITGSIKSSLPKDLVIPDEIDGKPVTTIGSQAFYNRDKIESITIGNNVKTIGESAFSSCANLKSVIMSNKVTSLENSVFNNCSNLTNVTFPDKLETIGNSTFAGCTSLKNITIPSNVKSIGTYAFSGCTSLESIVLPDSVETIGDFVFYNCTNLKNVKLPSDIESIPNYFFWNCTSLKSVTIPDSVKSMGYNVFFGCTNLESVTLPNGITSIGNSMFSGCSALKRIVIPENVTSIGTSAFKNCANLESIVIPKSLKSVGKSAFYGCGKLLKVNYMGTDEEWGKISIGENNSSISNNIMNYNYLATVDLLSATSTETSITTTSQVSMIPASVNISEFGTVFIPYFVYKNNPNDTAVVEYNNNEYDIKDGQKFEATLTDIPENYKGVSIVAISFVRVGDEAVYSRAKTMTVNNTTLDTID